MKILFFGRGVVGTQYAWAFENAGHTVAFYVRDGRKAQYGSYVDLEIFDARRSNNRLIKESRPIAIHEDIERNHDYDLIFVSVNPEQVASAVKYLAPRAGNATILFIGNFWRDIQESVRPIPLSQVVWGFPGCGGGFEGNTLYGGLYKTIHFGTFESEPTQRDSELHKLFAGAGFRVAVQKDFQSWLRNHFISNVAMEVEVIKSGGFKEAVSSYESLVGIARNIKEMIPVLKATGSKLNASTRIMSCLPPSVVGFLMRKVIFSPKSMPYALVAHNHYKVGPAVQEIISEAEKYGINVPRLYAAEKLRIGVQ
jgi:2-dehydropantoate 2-reductase